MPSMPLETNINITNSPESQGLHLQIRNASAEAPDKNRLLVLLDIDETLVQTHRKSDFSKKGLEMLAAGRVAYAFTEVKMGRIPHIVMERPGLRSFLESLSVMQDDGDIQVGLFTAGCRKYGRLIAKCLDPSGELFGDLILTRENCNRKSKSKDLTVLAKFPTAKEIHCNLARMVLVDNQPRNFINQPRNGILIADFEPFVQDLRRDRELSRILAMIYELTSSTDDVRTILPEVKPCKSAFV